MDYNVAVKTEFGERLSKAQTLKKVGRFYDLGSPYYLRVWGEHIHDGYYITGKETRRQAQVKLVQLLASEARIARGDKVLDIGCGMGGSSIWLARHLGATSVGITISSKQAMIAVERASQQDAEASFMLMDAEQMAFRPERPIFDAIWAVAVMTHLKGQQGFLSAASRLLKKGGRFIIFDWMLGPDIDDAASDTVIEQVSTGMLLSSLHRIRTYLEWFSNLGAEVTYASDVTGHTIRTWDVAFSVLTDPKVWKLALKANREERSLLLPFMKGLNPMKQAMLQGKLISGAIVARKR